MGENWYYRSGNGSQVTVHGNRVHVQKRIPKIVRLARTVSRLCSETMWSTASFFCPSFFNMIMYLISNQFSAVGDGAEFTA